MNDVYVRRVTDPNPLLVELARQACDECERWEHQEPHTSGPRRLNWTAIAAAAEQFGVPLAYVLDERERRARERQAST